MRIEYYLVLAATLVGIGIGSALSRSNLISIVMSIVTAGAGAVIAMAAFERQTPKNDDAKLFALCLGATLMIMIVLGCALAYRRFMASSTTDISDGNQLRH